ncbi:MAG: hypothetical protein ACK4V4_04660 [Sphingobacteriales bacterium]|jgi:hypothetical protein
MEHFKIFDWRHFFPSQENKNKYLAEVKEYINKNYTELHDQPGAIRYNLDNAVHDGCFNLFILNHDVNDYLFNFFKSKSVFIKFIRYRNPLYLKGEQELHYDWIVKNNEKRIEMFVLLDDMDSNNGGLVIMQNDTITPINTEAGSCIIMDSTILHGGTKNNNGKSRALIDIHIGVKTQGNEQCLRRILKKR